MFISIPDKFLVNVVFDNEYELNIENNNIEYATRVDRESTKIASKLKEKINEKIENVIIDKTKDTSVKDAIKNKCQMEVDDYLEKNNGFIYIDIDDEYISNSVKVKDDYGE